MRARRFGLSQEPVELGKIEVGRRQRLKAARPIQSFEGGRKRGLGPQFGPHSIGRFGSSGPTRRPPAAPVAIWPKFLSIFAAGGGNGRIAACQMNQSNGKTTP
jgi:hypothetical protein